MKDKDNFREKYIASFILHALGDTIGYKNSIWEFNYNIQNYNDKRETIEIISEFVSLGGITNIDLSGWTVSDDTLFNYEIAKFILTIKDKLEEKNIKKLKQEIIKMINKQTELKIERGFGLMTGNAINEWTDDKDERHTKYNEKSGGSGCSMRTIPIGLRYYKDEDLDKLIEISIITSKLTHNSPIGFLSGLASAYFIKLAINKIDIKKWGHLLIELYESDKVKKYIDTTNDDIYFDYRSTIRVWKKYISFYFDSNNNLNLIKIKRNLLSRLDMFQMFNEILYPNSEYSNIIGGTGPSSVIMAYSALLDCDKNWEKLTYYAMLHTGDSDTVGAIAGALYGIMYEFENVPQHLLKNIEMIDELQEMGNKFFELYH
jgi:ADP-ribosylarginine hydrolase